MKLRLTTLILIAMSIMNVHAVTKTITTNEFKVQYEECTENYAKASLKILQVVKSNAIKMGFILPKKIEFHIVKSDKEKLYVSGENANLITWEYKSMNDFLAPQKSGFNNVYGLCHEMGHLCMFNITPKYNWMTNDYSEGWANYFGSLMVDNVDRILGIKAWPDQHDYRKTTGMQGFLKSLQSDYLKKSPGFVYCSSFWYNLGTRIGKNNVYNFFNTINMCNINTSNSDIVFLNILKTYKLDTDFIEDFKKNKSYLLVVKPL